MKILFTGGKTGGHVVPLINLIKSIKAHECLYLGLFGEIEERLTTNNKIDFRGYHLKSKRDIFKSIREVSSIIKEFNPDIIVSSGGYVSFVPLIIAKFKKIPYYLIEENRVLGLTNSIFKRKAKKIFLSFPLDKERKNMILTGSLSYACLSRGSFNIDKSYINILVIGGSLGSSIMCDIAYNLSIELSSKYRVYLIAGRYFNKYYNESSKSLVVYEYINNLTDLMKECDVVISRGGSSTIFEALAYEKKLIIVPSRKVKKDHQYKNAVYIRDKRLGYLFNEEDSIKKLLMYVIKKDYILYNDKILNKNAIDDIRNMILNG